MQLVVKPIPPYTPPFVRSVSNPPLDDLPTRPLRPAEATASRSASLPPPPAVTVAAADDGDWQRFVDHLQQQGAVPGAGWDDPEQGVVTPANVSVKHMLAFLRNQAPATPADAEPMASRRSIAAAAPTTVAAPAQPATALTRDAGQPDADELALDEELRSWQETYRPRSAELTAVNEDREDDDMDVSETFGTTPRAELASLRRAALIRANTAFAEDAEPADGAQPRPRMLRFNEFGTVRVYTDDAEPGISGPVPDQRFLTKQHDGEWGQAPLHAPMSSHPVTADDDEEFVVHAPSHRDRSAAPTHAEHLRNQVFWTDFGRDDEPADAVDYLHRLQRLQDEVDESLRLNREMSEDIGVYF